MCAYLSVCQSVCACRHAHKQYKINMAMDLQRPCWAVQLQLLQLKWIILQLTIYEFTRWFVTQYQGTVVWNTMQHPDVNQSKFLIWLIGQYLGNDCEYRKHISRLPITNEDVTKGDLSRSRVKGLSRRITRGAFQKRTWALKNSMLYKNYIFQCMGQKFCVGFQRYPLNKNILPIPWKM